MMKRFAAAATRLSAHRLAVFCGDLVGAVGLFALLFIGLWAGHLAGFK